MAAWPISAQEISNVCVSVLGSAAAGVAVGNVVAGQTYSYNASGCIRNSNNSGNIVNSWTDPSGNHSTNGCASFYLPPIVRNTGFRCNGLFELSLVGTIDGGSCFQLGNSGTFVASSTGALVLYYNDGNFGDNSGSFSACITLGADGSTNSPPGTNVVTCSTSLTGGGTATRSARFWFTHPYPVDSNCANLRDALRASNISTNDSFQLSLGFIELPGGYYNNDYVSDVDDAVIASLGLYWRKTTRTGELGGAQGAALPASRLCRLRKSLAVEVLAALANVNLLGTPPDAMTYDTGHGLTNFPATLPCDAIAALAGEDTTPIVNYTALLRLYNSSGITNNFANDLVECSAETPRSLRDLSRDPTTQLSCPGINDSCGTAEAIYFTEPQDIFSTASFSDGANLRRYAGSTSSWSTVCGTIGGSPAWKITPAVGAVNRPFRVDTRGSNIDTVLEIFQGHCGNLVPVICNDNIDPFTPQSAVSFRTDGTNTYYIVAGGKGGLIGQLKLKVTSP